MTRTIDSVTVSAVEDRRLVLGDAQAARVLSIGSNWDSIRLGMRFSVKDDGANLVGMPRLVFGLMSAPSAGCANGPLGVTSHFLGIKSNVQATWTRTVSGGVTYYSVPAQAFSMMTQVGTTVVSAGTAGAIQVPTSTTDGWFWPVFVTITKGSPNFSFSLIRWNGTVDNIAASKDLFSRAMEFRSHNNSYGLVGYLNAILGASNYAEATTTIAVDEAGNGDLDSMVVGWDRGYAPLYISDIAWSKLA